jgi:hypothetical protein
MYTVYCHTHIESGRRYIGLTKKTVMQRWNQHVYTSTRNRGGWSHFANAIRKYGKDAFVHEVLAKYSSLQRANAAERRFIKKFKTTDPMFGFNLAPGGGFKPHPITNPWHRPEFRAKQLARPPRKPDALVKAKISAASIAYWRSVSPQKRKNRRNPWNRQDYRAKRATLPNPLLSHESYLKMVATHNTPTFKAAQSRRSRAAMTPTVRAKIAAALSGKKHSPEHIAKTTLAFKGKKHTVAALAKIKQAALDAANANSERNRTYVMQNGVVTHKVCERHGIVPVESCYVGKLASGRPRVECLLCMRERV